jgi:hypothetical protein
MVARASGLRFPEASGTHALLSAAAGCILFTGSTALAQTPTPTPTPLPIIVQWSPVPAGDRVTNYKLYEQVGTNYNLIATIPPNVTTWTMPPMIGSHIFVVTAVNATKEGPKSNQATWPPDPHPPGNLRITP